MNLICNFLIVQQLLMGGPAFHTFSLSIKLLHNYLSKIQIQVNR